jgi:hypothetical protein
VLDAQVFDLSPHALDAKLRVRERLLRQNDEKLFTTVAVKTVADPKLLLDRARNSAKRLVTREVPETIVVCLECVHIAQRSTVPVAIARAASVEGGEIFLEPQTVGNRGERIRPSSLVVSLGITAKGAVSGLELTVHLGHSPGRLDSRLKFLEFNGLRGVFVGPTPQTFDEVPLAATRRKNEVGVPWQRRFLFAYLST